MITEQQEAFKIKMESDVIKLKAAIADIFGDNTNYLISLCVEVPPDSEQVAMKVVSNSTTSKMALMALEINHHLKFSNVGKSFNEMLMLGAGLPAFKERK